MRIEERLNFIALGDADRNLRAKEKQIDFIHVWRKANYKLWQYYGVELVLEGSTFAKLKESN